MSEESRLTFLHDEPKILSALGFVFNASAFQAFRHKPDGGDGRAQFMRNARDKIAFQFVQPELSLESAPGREQTTQSRACRNGDEQTKPGRARVLPGKKRRRIAQENIDLRCTSPPTPGFVTVARTGLRSGGNGICLGGMRRDLFFAWLIGGRDIRWAFS